MAPIKRSNPGGFLFSSSLLFLLYSKLFIINYSLRCLMSLSLWIWAVVNVLGVASMDTRGQAVRCWSEMKQVLPLCLSGKSSFLKNLNFAHKFSLHVTSLYVSSRLALPRPPSQAWFSRMYKNEALLHSSQYLDLPPGYSMLGYAIILFFSCPYFSYSCLIYRFFITASLLVANKKKVLVLVVW